MSKTPAPDWEAGVLFLSSSAAADLAQMTEPKDEARIFGAIKDAIHLDTMDETDRAIELLEPFVLEFPYEPAVHLYLAWYLRRCGRFPKAIEHAKRAVSLAPKSSRASLVLFHTLWRAGNKDVAIEEIRRFLPIRRTAKYTFDYVDILRKWEAGDRGEGAYIAKDEDDWKRLVQ
jgi:tetratricopeptide (TPR) repeat protein